MLLAEDNLVALQDLLLERGRDLREHAQEAEGTTPKHSPEAIWRDAQGQKCYAVGSGVKLASFTAQAKRFAFLETSCWGSKLASRVSSWQRCSRTHKIHKAVVRQHRVLLY